MVSSGEAREEDSGVTAIPDFRSGPLDLQTALYVNPGSPPRCIMWRPTQ